MQLYLVRHAESANNSRPTYQRVEDPPITPVGRLQAGHLADWLATLRADALVTSPFLRTLQTVLPVMKSTDFDLTIWHNTFERGGCYRGFDETNLCGAPGMGRSDIIRAMGAFAERTCLDDSIGEDGWWGEQTPESDQRAAQRAGEVCDRILETFPLRSVAVLLIHADLKRLMLQKMLGDCIDVSRLGPIRNAGVTKVNRCEGEWQLDYFNSVTHLPAKLITGNEH